MAQGELFHGEKAGKDNPIRQVSEDRSAQLRPWAGPQANIENEKEDRQNKRDLVG